MADPIAVSSWKTAGVLESLGLTVFLFLISGNLRTPPDLSRVVCTTFVTYVPTWGREGGESNVWSWPYILPGTKSVWGIFPSTVCFERALGCFVPLARYVQDRFGADNQATMLFVRANGACPSLGEDNSSLCKSARRKCFRPESTEEANYRLLNARHLSLYWHAICNPFSCQKGAWYHPRCPLIHVELNESIQVHNHFFFHKSICSIKPIHTCLFSSQNFKSKSHLELVQIDPQIVCVEELVLGNVFKRTLVLVRSHSTFS